MSGIAMEDINHKARKFFFSIGRTGIQPSLNFYGSEPVARLHTLSEFAFVSSRLKMIGLESELVDAIDCEQRIDHIGSNVVSILCFPGCEEYARYYADLTRRNYTTIREANEILCYESASVVFVENINWNSSLVNSIRKFEEQFGLAIGIMPIIEYPSPFYAVVKLYIAWAEPPAASTDITWISSLLRLKNDSLVYRALDNSNADNHPAEALEHNSNILILDGHGDGFDAALPGRNVLCYRLSSLSEPRFSKSIPECDASGWCYRLNIPVEEVSQKKNVFSVERIGARSMLLLTCHAWRVAIAEDARAPAILSRILSTSVVSSIMAPYGLFFASRSTILDALQVVLSSRALGDAVSHINRLPSARALGWHIIAYGDSQTKLVKQGTSCERQNLDKHRAFRKRLRLPERCNRVHFLHDVIDTIISEFENKAQNAKNELILQRLVSSIHLLKDLDKSKAEISANDQKALIQSVACIGMEGIWLRVADWRYFDDVADKCSFCKMTLAVVTGGRGHRWARVLTKCPRCGYLSDEEPGSAAIQMEIVQTLHGTILTVTESGRSSINSTQSLFCIQITSRYIGSLPWSASFFIKKPTRTINLSKLIWKIVEKKMLVRRRVPGERIPTMLNVFSIDRSLQMKNRSCADIFITNTYSAHPYGN